MTTNAEHGSRGGIGGGGDGYGGGGASAPNGMMPRLHRALPLPAHLSALLDGYDRVVKVCAFLAARRLQPTLGAVAAMAGLAEASVLQLWTLMPVPSPFPLPPHLGLPARSTAFR